MRDMEGGERQVGAVFGAAPARAAHVHYLT